MDSKVLYSIRTDTLTANDAARLSDASKWLFTTDTVALAPPIPQAEVAKRLLVTAPWSMDRAVVEESVNDELEM